MIGKILKGIGGFYYVHVPGYGIYECRAKGIFRNRKVKPLVGDDVDIDIIDDNLKKGNVSDILPRKNELVRPAVANVDQAVILFAVRSPEPNLNLLDRFLILMQQQNVPVTILFNKSDLGTEEMIQHYLSVYDNSGCRCYAVSMYLDDSMEMMHQLLDGKTTVLAGPSGVGKSSLMNRLNPEIRVETGEVSKKIQRGKHTTRHSELFHISDKTYVMDTPGFTSLNVFVEEEREIRNYYPEFSDHAENCKFPDCVHVGEKICGVKDAVKQGKIAVERYENYLQIYEEVKNTPKY